MTARCRASGRAVQRSAMSGVARSSRFGAVLAAQASSCHCWSSGRRTVPVVGAQIRKEARAPRPRPEGQGRGAICAQRCAQLAMDRVHPCLFTPCASRLGRTGLDVAARSRPPPRRTGSVVRGSSPLSSTPKVQVRALITDQGPDCCSAPSAMRPQRGTGSRRDDRSIPGLSDLRFRLSGVFRKRSEGPMRIAAQPVPGPDDGARQGSCRTRRPTSG